MPGVDQLAGDVGRWFAATFADATGGELELDQTDSPDALILGDTAALAATAAHLRAMGAAFDRTAGGLRRIDVGRWTGAAADAFHAAFQNSPRGWIDAADAFGHAADVLEGFRSTVVWAKDRAAQAVELHRQGQAASEQARQARDSATPGPFVDPGLPTIDRARQLLADTRSRRDSAGVDAARALAAATATAPPPPSGWDRLVGEGSDAIGAQVTEFGHLVGGVGEGVEGLARFARTLNPSDPYNVTHPAQYLDGLSTAAAGLVHSALHPIAVVKDVLGTGWGSDPSRALGHLIPNVVLAVATSGGGAAAATGERAAVSTAAADARIAQNLAGHQPRVGDIERRLDSLPVRDTGPVSVAPAEAAVPPHVTPPPLPPGTGPVDVRVGEPPLVPPLTRAQPFPIQSEVGFQYRGEHDVTDSTRWNEPDVVHIMSPTELEAHRLFVRDGRLYSAGTGFPFDTGGAATLHTVGDGQAMFVMDKDGNLYASAQQEKGVLHHSSFFGGGPVAAAGEISVREGVPTLVTRRSGHYFPEDAQQEQVRTVLQEQGVDMTRTKFTKGW